MHLPTYASPVSAQESPQIRLLLIGPPKSGKTFAAATFPNPLFVDFDDSLTSKELRTKYSLHSLDFCDPAWIKEHFSKRVIVTASGTRIKAASAFVDFLNSPDIEKMTYEQTLVIDSLSTLGDAVRAELEASQPTSKSGEPDTFWFWREWAAWFRDLCTRLKQLSTHVVVIAHENEIRDSETGKVTAFKLALPGQEMTPRLPQFFTDIYRQTKEVTVKPGAASDKAATSVEEKYLWQVKTSPQFMCNTRMKTDKMYVPAHYDSIKY